MPSPSSTLFCVCKAHPKTGSKMPKGQITTVWCMICSHLFKDLDHTEALAPPRFPCMMTLRTPTQAVKCFLTHNRQIEEAAFSPQLHIQISLHLPAFLSTWAHKLVALFMPASCSMNFKASALGTPHDSDNWKAQQSKTWPHCALLDRSQPTCRK